MTKISVTVPYRGEFTKNFSEKRPSVPYRAATTVPYRAGSRGPYNDDLGVTPCKKNASTTATGWTDRRLWFI